jgi:protein phosphatase
MERGGMEFGNLTAASSPFRWTSASCSHVGLVREINEDACLDQPERGLWAVADGMGGHTVGDFASSMVVEALSNVSLADSLESFVGDMRKRLQTVNDQLRAEAATRNAEMIGSTVALLLAHDGRCAYLWAGDSRIYLYRNGRLKLLTRDHNQLEELRARGVDIADGAIDHRLLRGITRAVGAMDTLDPEEGVVELNDGDVFLLCSDGLSNAVSEQEIMSALLPGNCQRAASKLIDIALERGGRDNISAVVVHAEDVQADKTLFNPAL